jgi:hypothetical protein
MMKLMFYRGPGDLVTRLIRLLTQGPYSHVELQFTGGRRFFTSGHGIFVGAHMLRDHKIYGPLWDTILIPATQEQEYAAQRVAFGLIGLPFDMRAMIRFMLPWSPMRKGRYCSGVVLDVLQRGLHMFPEQRGKVSPNSLHNLFLAHKHTLICDSLPDAPVANETQDFPDRVEGEADPLNGPLPATWFR